MHVKFWDDESVTVYLGMIQKLVDAPWLFQMA